LIEHGTLRQSTHDAVFFVFDVEAANWAEMLQKIIAFAAPLSQWIQCCGTGVDCNSTTDSEAMDARDKRATEDAISVYSYPHPHTGAAIQTTLAIAAGLVKSSSSAVVVV
jgi:hypothetical protein